MFRNDKEMEDFKNEFLMKYNNLEEVEKIYEADHLLVFHRDKKEKIIETKNIFDENDYEENEKIMSEVNDKIKAYYVKDKSKKVKTKTKKQLMKIKKFKEMVVNIVSDFIVEVEDNDDSEILLVLFNDFSSWDVTKVEHPPSKIPRVHKRECEIFDLSYYWFKRVNEQKSVEDTIDLIRKNLRKKYVFN